MTVMQLAIECARLMKVIVSDDEEGNGYHEIFYGMTMTDDVIAEIEDLNGCEPMGLEPHTVMLG